MPLGRETKTNMEKELKERNSLLHYTDETTIKLLESAFLTPN